MRHTTLRVPALAALLQVACTTSHSQRPPLEGDAPSLAGGETSEFSGGDVPAGYCPIELSRTALDLEREDVAAIAALAAGHHEVALRWSRVFPDPAISGFEEETDLILDVTPIAAEDVLCSTGGGGGYEGGNGEDWTLRRFDMEVALSTADRAVQTTFRTWFFPVRPGLLLSGISLPFEELDGSLELGVDPELTDATQTLRVDLQFDGGAVKGGLSSQVTLPGPVFGDDTPRWSPVAGVFPAPDAGCETGTRVSLDEHFAPLGSTPRAAYEASLARFPEPISATWQDPDHPNDLRWTELVMTPGAPTHACGDVAGVNVYTSLRLETSDGLLSAEPLVVVNVGLQFDASGQSVPVAPTLSSAGEWMPRAEFEAAAGMRDLELGAAEYGRFALYQDFHLGRGHMDGDFNLAKWEGYFARRVADTSLRWCAGSSCEQHWCRLTATAETACE